MDQKRAILEALASKRAELRRALRIINKFGQQQPGQQEAMQHALRAIDHQIQRAKGLGCVRIKIVRIGQEMLIEHGQGNSTVRDNVQLGSEEAK